MIDTDKYEGHTKGDAITPDSWRIVGDNFVMNGESPSFRYIAYVQVNNDGENTIVGFSDADAQLIADAPLHLEEVKRLRGIIAGIVTDMDEDWRFWRSELKKVIE